MTANDTFDNDTLVVNVLIHLDHTAAASSTHTVDFILSHGVDTTTETVTIQAIDAVISNDTSVSAMTIISVYDHYFSTILINNNKIRKIHK